MILLVNPAKQDLTPHRIKTLKRTKFGERAFSHAGPAAWNRLPEAVRQAQTQLHLKKLLKTFLFNEFL